MIRSFLLLLLLFLPALCCPAHAVAQDESAYLSGEDSEPESPQPKKNARRKARNKTEQPAETPAVFSVQYLGGTVEVQHDGAKTWSLLDMKSREPLRDMDILKTGDVSNVTFSSPGKCTILLEQGTSLMLDGIAKQPPVVTLVKGTVLARCLPGQQLQVKNTLVKLSASGAAFGMSYDYDTGIAAAASYDLSVSSSAASSAPSLVAAESKTRPQDNGTVMIARAGSLDGPQFQLPAGQQIIFSKEGQEAQPVEIQSFFADFQARVQSLMIAPAENVPEKTKQPKTRSSPKTRPATTIKKLTINRFETRREQEKNSSSPGSSGLKNRQSGN